MKPIAIFFHTKLHGPEFGIDEDFSIALVKQQMQTLEDCGLFHTAKTICCGFNDAFTQVRKVKKYLRNNAGISAFEGKRSELPTLHWMQQWLRGTEPCNVLYFHTKGITHPGDPLCNAWRACMEYYVLWNWYKCVLALEQGYDACGPHWLTREKYGPQVKTPFFGGNFWWATSEFLNTLPELPSTSTCREDDFLAEQWIGSGKRLPLVKKLADHWPGLKECSQHNILKPHEMDNDTTPQVKTGVRGVHGGRGAA